MNCPNCQAEMEQEPHAEPMHGLRLAKLRTWHIVEYRCDDCGLEAKESKREGFVITWDPRVGE